VKDIIPLRIEAGYKVFRILVGLWLSLKYKPYIHPGILIGLNQDYMGWKTSSLIIRANAERTDEEILGALGYHWIEKSQDLPYDSAICPDRGEIYIGKYKGNIIVSAEGLSSQFLKAGLSAEEQDLIELFPEAEICAVSLQSAINHWGFAVIKDGHKVRVKSGDADNGTTIDDGEPLEPEKELLDRSKINEDGLREYVLDDSIYTEDQIGENFVFEYYKRYTGTSLDLDDQLMDTQFTGYRVIPIKEPYKELYSGLWKGEYIYGDGYGSHTGKKEEFLLSIEMDEEGQFKGTCVDSNKKNDAPANVYGFLFDHFICFVKQYSVTYSIDATGVTKRDDSKKSPRVFYSGLLDALEGRFRGTWNIEFRQAWGEWHMRRKGKLLKAT
jgi:hypothetical protein